MLESLCCQVLRELNAHTAMSHGGEALLLLDSFLEGSESSICTLHLQRQCGGVDHGDRG